MITVRQLARGVDIDLPVASKPVGSYHPFVWDEQIVYVSGQVPMIDGVLKYRGVAGETADLNMCVEAAQICGLNILAQLAAATESYDCATINCLKLTGFVASTSTFDRHASVVNGASDLIAKVLGDAGRHARSAVGVIGLPGNALVEVDAVFRVRFAG